VLFRLAAALLVAALLAGCALFPPMGMLVTIPATRDAAALPVTIVDHGGIIRAARPDAHPGDVESRTSVQAVPGREDAVLLTKIGGACDDRAIVTIDPDGDRYRVTVEGQTSAKGCRPVGIIRTLLLTLTEPVGVDAFAPS
jgi:hypothetical protein